MFRCAPGFACLGATPTDSCGCKAGYTGILCGECTSGYYDSDGRCLECAGTVDVGRTIAFIVCMSVLVALFLVVLFIKVVKAQRNSSLFAVAIRFLQGLGILLQFDLDWSVAACFIIMPVWSHTSVVTM